MVGGVFEFESVIVVAEEVGEVLLGVLEAVLKWLDDQDELCDRLQGRRRHRASRRSKYNGGQVFARGEGQL